MSIPALNWAFSAHVEPSSAKFILVALANYADEDGHCYPSQRRLARDTGQGERSVRRQLAKLEHDGWITRCKRRRKNGSHTSDAFDLDMQNSHRPSVPAANLAAGQSKQDQRPNGAEPFPVIVQRLDELVQFALLFPLIGVGGGLLRPLLDRFDGPVVVTGATGYVAGHVVRELLDVFYENRFMVIPGQDSTMDRFEEFGSHFGQPILHVIKQARLQGHPTIIQLTNVMMFLGLLALREFGRQRGWIAGQFRVPSETMNHAMDDYDESKIELNVAANSLSVLNKIVKFAPES